MCFRMWFRNSGCLTAVVGLAALKGAKALGFRRPRRFLMWFRHLISPSAAVGPAPLKCVEVVGVPAAQVFPDAVNQVNFPDAVLRPGSTYRHKSEWRFYTK